MQLEIAILYLFVQDQTKSRVTGAATIGEDLEDLNRAEVQVDVVSGSGVTLECRFSFLHNLVDSDL